LSGVPEDPVGRLRLGITPLDLSIDSVLADQPHDRLEEVLVEPQLIAVKVIYQSQLFWGVIAQVSQGAADMGEVLLLDVGVVVLAIRPRSGRFKIPEKAPKNENRKNSIDLLADRPMPFFVTGAPR